MEFLKLAISIHMLIGCFMLTNPNVFESQRGPEEFGYFFKLPKLPMQKKIIEFLES
jgi:hypothetical protein